MVRKAPAHVQPRDGHTRRARDVGAFADIRLPGVGVGALRTGVEGQRRDVARCRHLAQKVRRQFHLRPELGAEVIGRTRHGQLVAHADFGAVQRDLRDQLGQFRRRVDAVGFHPAVDGIGDFRPRPDRVVVVDRRIGGQAPDQVDLERAGAVIAADAGGGQVFHHRLARVRLDRIGDHAGKAVDEPTRRRLRRRGRKEQHRVFRLFVPQIFGRIGPDRLGESHRLISLCQQDASPFPASSSGIGHQRGFK